MKELLYPVQVGRNISTKRSPSGRINIRWERMDRQGLPRGRIPLRAGQHRREDIQVPERLHGFHKAPIDWEKTGIPEIA
jgi:hypothetical protein